MHTIHTTGKPFERGAQQGTQCRDLARPWFQHNLDSFPEGGSHRAAARADLNAWVQRIGSVSSDVLDECRGLAAGLQMSDEDYLAAVLLEQSSWLPMACTTCGVVDYQGRPFIGKTDDIYAHERGLNVLADKRPRLQSDIG